MLSSRRDRFDVVDAGAAAGAVSVVALVASDSPWEGGGGPHLNEACRIDVLSRGSVLGYEILTNN